MFWNLPEEGFVLEKENQAKTREKKKQKRDDASQSADSKVVLPSLSSGFASQYRPCLSSTKTASMNSFDLQYKKPGKLYPKIKDRLSIAKDEDYASDFECACVA